MFVANLPLVAGGVVAPGRAETRTVELSGIVVATSYRRAHQLFRQLVRVVADRGPDPVGIFYTPDDVQLELAGYLSGSVEAQPAGGTFLRYRLTLECPDPVAKGDGKTADLTAGPVNGGDAPVWPTLTLTLSGTVTSLRVGSTTTGDFVELAGLSGSVVFIDSRPGFETVEVDGVAALDTLTTASTFFPLLPGGNDLYVTVLAGGGSAAGQVEWRDGWLL
jgi:hypothetical protein